MIVLACRLLLILICLAACRNSRKINVDYFLNDG